jgi:hypothetical protein
VRDYSLSRPESRWRLIAPKAIVIDGFRLHTRAPSLTDACFKDFLLSQILEICGSRKSKTSAASDDNWHLEVALEVGANHEPSERPAKVIALDYWMLSSKATIKVRRALFFYALRRLCLENDPSAGKPQDHQNLLLSREVIHEDHG